MRKHDEGYALALVLVVLLVLGILVSIMLSFSLQHVQTQARYVDRMQDQYAAAGEIEAIVGQLQTTGTCTISKEIVAEDSTADDFRLEVSFQSVQIDCILQLTGEDVEIAKQDDHYAISGVTGVQYISYKINSTGGGA